MFKKRYYWDSVSDQISYLFRRTFTKDMSILEIGFGGGHFLEWLWSHGYRTISGIEIRENQYNETIEQFKKKKLPIELINGDVLNHKKHYDAVYSTGLIQCLNPRQRLFFFEHVSSIANVAIFTVPEILENRNMESNQLTAVAGCKEYKTGNIPYELSRFYDVVNVGRIDKEVTHIEDTFIYYICIKG